MARFYFMFIIIEEIWKIDCLSQSSRRWGEMIGFLRALRNIGDVLGSAQVFIYYCEFWFFLHAKIYYILYIFKEAKLAKFIRYEVGWKMMRDDVIMWWCGDVVMRWRSRIKNMRHWVFCKTTAPKDNTTLTDTIFFSPTLKGGKLFIVSCEFWVFLYAKIFLYPLCF